MDNRKIDVVDFHAHILPGADHGSDSIETSIKQLKLAAGEGVTRIIATPHFYPHRHTLDKFLEKRAACAKVLLDACDGTLPEVKLGAEVLLCPGLDKIQGLEKLCLSGTKYLLLELPFSDFRSTDKIPYTPPSLLPGSPGGTTRVSVSFFYTHYIHL